MKNKNDVENKMIEEIEEHEAAFIKQYLPKRRSVDDIFNTEKLLNHAKALCDEIAHPDFDIYKFVGEHGFSICTCIDSIVGTMPRKERTKYKLENYYKNLPCYLRAND